MTIHERMIPRTEREKDLLKYGRGQERERIIKLLEERLGWVPYGAIGMIKNGQMMSITVEQLIALIKGEK